MPRIAQILGEILPVTHFIRLTRGIMLRDAALIELYPELVALAIFTVVAMTLAALRFTKRLD
jgi:ABC-2 type transport system permease protein